MSFAKYLPHIKKTDVIFLILITFFDMIVLGTAFLAVLLLAIYLVLSMINVFKKIFYHQNPIKLFLSRTLYLAISLLLTFSSMYIQNNIAMNNAEIIIASVEKYYRDHQTYPTHLEELVPSYLKKIPTAKYHLFFAQFDYYQQNSAANDSKEIILKFMLFPPFTWNYYFFSKQSWNLSS